ncbi:hypothetical protein FGO68_gene8768 [Halteria grandinella]|uniref:Uncharacterized protein n=1 Tax=Halteria grandinella TaxID=5974 RepID=A0A8J8SV90_HALGN|nr:hypothetical protein FGO68_gene8768 [Halteria grandinella]
MSGRSNNRLREFRYPLEPHGNNVRLSGRLPVRRQVISEFRSCKHFEYLIHGTLTSRSQALVRHDADDQGI